MNKLQLVFLMLIFNSVSGQNLTLKDLKIEPFYPEPEKPINLLYDLDEVSKYSNEDINSNFSNFNDLDFLQSIPKDNKVVMLGETHYAKNILFLRNRIFFGLNSNDYYPLIIIENPYSITAFYNHYIHLKNNKEAKDFLDNELSGFLYTEDDLNFLDDLREWNKRNKEKQLSIGGNDLEFTYDVIVDKILRPYFYQLNKIDKTEIDKIIELGIDQENDFFVKIVPYLLQAKKENLIGKYPFITPQYIENVIKNYSSTNNAFRYSFEYYRQMAIIRNISDENFHGKFLEDYKIMIHGGGKHMKNHFEFPDNANFLSEGSYFNHNFDLTKNKTFSIMIECLAYVYDEMSNRKIEDCIPQGSQYTRMIKTFQKGFSNNLIDENQPYFFYEKKNELLKLISQFYYQNKSISFSKQIWNNMKNLGFFDESAEQFFESKDENFNYYDKYIIVPASKITTARLKS